jgi:O-antigen/teichoic acid export membrane protein
MMLVAALAVLAIRPRLDLLGLALLLPAAATLVWSYQRMRRLVTLERTGGWPRAAEFFRDVAPIGAGIVLSAVYFRIDVFLIEQWVGLEAVAQYSAVFRLVEALRLFPAAALAVILPSLVRARDIGPLARVAAAVTGFAAALTVPAYFAAWVMVPFVYGAGYAAAAPAFQILMLAFPLLSLNYALTHQVIAWDGHRAFAAMCAAAVVVNVGLNWILIPRYGIAGAAWATLATEAFLAGCCAVALLRLRAHPRSESVTFAPSTSQVT